MSTSYQQIDTRLEGVENALLFTMRTINVSPGVTLFDLYRQALTGGLALQEKVALTDGTDPIESAGA